MEESPRFSDQQYQQHREYSDKSPTSKATLSKERMSSMAPNFRVIKFIYDQVKQNKTLLNNLEKLPDNVQGKGVRPTLMKLIAYARKGSSEFNLSVQNLTILDYQLANKLKEQGKDNPDILEKLSKNTDILKLTSVLVKKILIVVDELIK